VKREYLFLLYIVKIFGYILEYLYLCSGESSEYFFEKIILLILARLKHFCIFVSQFKTNIIRIMNEVVKRNGNVIYISTTDDCGINQGGLFCMVHDSIDNDEYFDYFTFSKEEYEQNKNNLAEY
jgi:hypothetical protein